MHACVRVCSEHCTCQTLRAQVYMNIMCAKIIHSLFNLMYPVNCVLIYESQLTDFLAKYTKCLIK
jgi:hypothetical protein